MNIQLILTTLVIYATAYPDAHSAVISSSSTARQIEASAEVTGTLAGAALAQVSATAGPVNEAAGSAPAPYSSSPAMVTAGASTNGILNLSTGVSAVAVTAASDVDGEPGARSTSAESRITGATADLELNLGGLPGNLTVLSVTVGDGTTVITSNAAVNYDGNLMSPSGSSNLLSINDGISIRVLGSPVSIGPLSAGAPTTITINTGIGTTVTGTITITPDLYMDTGSPQTSITASAMSLSISADLSLSSGLGTQIAIDSDIYVNRSTASMAAMPVPEPAPAAFAAGTILMGLLRRKR